MPIPHLFPWGESDYRFRKRHLKIDNAVVQDLYSDRVVGGTGGAFNHYSDLIVLSIGRTGSWHFTPSDGRGTTIEMPRDRFVARLNDAAWDFGIGPGTRSTLLVLPTAELRPLLPHRSVVGPVASAEMRVLMAHVAVVQETVEELSPDGVSAARSALVELTKAVLTGTDLDADQPPLALALAEAARRIGERLLTDRDLSPRVLADELNVSVRTLSRAFAATGESISAYIRRRRLERARQDLTAPGPGFSVSEVAARYHFSDSSHFIRAFKRAYGRTPAQWARGDD